MHARRTTFIATIGIAICASILFAHLAQAQQTPADTSTPATIRAETRLVLVDAVVTDKKGKYVRDLAAKDFKVWEDNKEQPIKSFSFEEEAASADKSQKQYLVLFFDNSTMDAGDQMKAASDLGVPVVGVGLLYGQGYFRQDFSADGQQQTLYPVNDPGQLPIQPLRQANGEWLRLQIQLPGSKIWLQQVL